MTDGPYAETIAMLRVAIDRFEESRHAILITAERLGTETVGGEECAMYATLQAEQCADGAKSTVNAIFRGGPDANIGAVLDETAAAMVQDIQELRRKIDSCQFDIDQFVGKAHSCIRLCEEYIREMSNYGRQ